MKDTIWTEECPLVVQTRPAQHLARCLLYGLDQRYIIWKRSNRHVGSIGLLITILEKTAFTTLGMDTAAQKRVEILATTYEAITTPLLIRRLRASCNCYSTPKMLPLTVGH